jgi:MYXO-CTERM domain-containing protein
MKTLLVLFVAALAAAPAAAGDGFPQGGQQYGAGITAGPKGPQYVAVGIDQAHTLLTTLQYGGVTGASKLDGSFGIPLVTQSQTGGLSADGRTLILEEPALAAPSQFVVLDARTLRERYRFILGGIYAFDALSPDGSTLYLIQRVDANDYSRYIVRAYDLVNHHLLPGRIADRTQKGWVMQGVPVTRGTSDDGRWVYTLYSNPTGYPFVHALDTVRGVAHCVGIPWPQGKDQGPLWNLQVVPHGGTVDIHWRSGRPFFRVDTASWRASPVAPAHFPWYWPVVGGLAALVLVAGERIRRRRRNTPVSVQGGSDVPTARAPARRSLRRGPRALGARRRPVVHGGARR